MPRGQAPCLCKTHKGGMADVEHIRNSLQQTAEFWDCVRKMDALDEGDDEPPDPSELSELATSPAPAAASSVKRVPASASSATGAPAAAPEPAPEPELDELAPPSDNEDDDVKCRASAPLRYVRC